MAAKNLVSLMNEQIQPERKREGDDFDLNIGVNEGEEKVERKPEGDDFDLNIEVNEGEEQVERKREGDDFDLNIEVNEEEEKVERKPEGEDFDLNIEVNEGEEKVERKPEGDDFDLNIDVNEGEENVEELSACDLDRNVDPPLDNWLMHLDREVLDKYNQQVHEKVFLISDHPDPSPWAPIVPVFDIKKENSYLYDPVVDLAKLAIDKYNEENDEEYVFVDLVKVNLMCVEGFICYITFKVKNLKACRDGDGTRLETFQARVWRRIKEPPLVDFCRPEPIKLQC